MPQITSGIGQIATWSTGDLVVMCGCIGFVVAGFMFFSGRLALSMLVAVVLGITVASSGMGLSRWLHGIFASG
jgi:hypothetical protein